MTDDRIEGGLKKGLSKAQDTWGGLTGDTRTQAQGKANATSGSVQDVVGQAKHRAEDLYDEVESYAKEQPLRALAITLAVGAVIGFVLRGGRKTVYR